LFFKLHIFLVFFQLFKFFLYFRNARGLLKKQTLEKTWLKLNPVKLCDYLKMGDSDSDDDGNKYLFSLIKTKIYQEAEKLKQVKEAHSRGADINPTDEKSGLTLLQTAQKKDYETIVKYLEDKISENETFFFFFFFFAIFVEVCIAKKYLKNNGGGPGTILN
jgi:hypothetical protein